MKGIFLLDGVSDVWVPKEFNLVFMIFTDLVIR